LNGTSASFNSGINAIGQEQAFSWQRTSGTASDVYSINADSGSAYLRNNTTSNVLMTWLEGGNVGIGNPTPGDRLVVNGNLGVTDGSFASGESYSLYLGDKNAFINSTFGQRVRLGAFNGFDFGFAQNGDLSLSSTWMSINGSGNVGIGNTPNDGFTGYKLQVGSTSDDQTYISIGCASSGVGPSNGLVIGNDSSGANIFQRENLPLNFWTNNTQRMSITSGGQQNMDSDLTGANIVVWRNSSASNPFGLNLTYTGSSPNGTSNNFLYCADSTVPRFVARSNGGVANYQANDVNLSDERTKKDIEPLESYWDKFKGIEIVKFKYIDQTHDDFNIGVIAQQVESIAPEFVDIDGWDTNPKLNEEEDEILSEAEPLKSIYTSDLHHATIKVLQEAMAKIEKLETEIDSLKNQIK
jgi:hypothetical protein